MGKLYLVIVVEGKMKLIRNMIHDTLSAILIVCLFVLLVCILLTICTKQ